MSEKVELYKCSACGTLFSSLAEADACEGGHHQRSVLTIVGVTYDKCSLGLESGFPSQITVVSEKPVYLGREKAECTYVRLKADFANKSMAG